MIAVLAVAVLALPPVVNGILAKAAQQADVSWLRDGDFEPPEDLEPPDNLDPNDFRGRQPPPDFRGRVPPTPPPDSPPPCTPVARGPETTIPSTQVSGTGSLDLPVEPGTLAVAFEVEAREVAGSPSFVLLEDGKEVWSDSAFRVRQSFRANDTFPSPTPGSLWELTYDLGSTAHGGITLSLVAVRCAEASR